MIHANIKKILLLKEPKMHSTSVSVTGAVVIKLTYFPREALETSTIAPYFLKLFLTRARTKSWPHTGGHFYQSEFQRNSRKIAWELKYTCNLASPAGKLQR